MNEQLADAVAASWSLPLWATLLLLASGLIYLRGWRRARLTRELELPPWRMGCFFAGLAAVWCAIASPLDALGSWLLLAHMAQHLVLMSVAPPLLILGAPTVPLLRGLPRRWVRDGAGPLLASRSLHALARFATHPIPAWLLMNAAYLGWHIPAACELALRSSMWHEAEHACFLLTSLLFWWTVLQPWPSRPRWSRWAAVPLLITADLVNTALSAFLAFSGRVLYPTYAAAPRIFGVSAAQDQAAAGAFMWVIGSAIYWIPAIALTMSLLSPRPRAALVSIGGPPNAGRLGAEVQGFDLLRLPWIGALLRSRYGRQSLQAAALLVMCIVLAHGLLGHRMAAMNLAGIVPWNVVRAGGVLGLIFFGNVFCMACPFTLPRELGRRVGWARLRWPRWLRVKWLAVGLMLFFFFSYERFSLWDSPVRTAWLLIAYVATAFVVDMLFQGASFCKYVCPIGQFNFVGSLLSPFTVAVRSQQVCTACSTHDCIRGNATQRGCELDLFLPQKHSNADCTLCMDCVKACPHDNVGISPRSISADLLSARRTSSLGMLDHRMDVAAIALVLVVAAFGSAAVMVEPGAALLGRLTNHIPTLATTPAALLATVAGVLCIAAVVWMTALRVGADARESFCRAALALVPLGMAMWAAHLLFHLSNSVSSSWPVLAQAGQDLHLALLGQPHWLPGTVPGPSLLQAQLLLLDAGLLLSLYVAWRGGGEQDGRVLRVLPLALLMIALYACGFWLLLLPMQMRGMMSMGAM